MQKENNSEINSETLFLSDDLNTKNEEVKKPEENEDFGVETKATIDSRIYERPSFFLGIPIILIVFGGIASKYESIFSVEYEGKAVPVLYHGLCLVSVGDHLVVSGKWYKGKKLGIQGNVVVADRVENLNSGMIYAKK
ncbi:MAG: hypothetical protein ACPK85_06125 [Methanosarcina sp.]